MISLGIFGDFTGQYIGDYPLVICYIAIENGPVEIVDLPMKIAWWIFPVRYVSLPEGKP